MQARNALAVVGLGLSIGMVGAGAGNIIGEQHESDAAAEIVGIDNRRQTALGQLAGEVATPEALTAYRELIIQTERDRSSAEETVISEPLGSTALGAFVALTGSAITALAFVTVRDSWRPPR